MGGRRLELFILTPTAHSIAYSITKNSVFTRALLHPLVIRSQKRMVLSEGFPFPEG